MKYGSNPNTLSKESPKPDIITINTPLHKKLPNKYNRQISDRLMRDQRTLSAAERRDTGEVWGNDLTAFTNVGMPSNS